jgi:hypothetical protein
MIKKALVLAALALSSLAIPGCLESRLTSCQNDNDCPARDGGSKYVCYNLRCVECHYDGDCPGGKVCGSNNTCESIDSRQPEPDGPPPAKTLEECAKRCKPGNDACGAACREQFKP